MFSGLKNNKFLAFALSALLALGFVGCGSSKQDTAKTVKKIGIIQLVQHGALDAANKGFVDGLASRGYKDGENIKIDQQNAQGDQSNLKTISQRFVNNKVDLIYAIATPAAQIVANETKTIPIVGSAITDYVAAKLVKSNDKPGGNVTGTTDYTPQRWQVDLALKLLSQAKTVGALYNSSEVNSQMQVEEMKQYAAEKGLKVIEATVTSVNDIPQAVQSLVGKADFIYCPTDNTIASAMANVVQITSKAKVPVIAGDETLVKAGATAGLSVDYYKLGFQAGLMAADILDGKAKPADMPIQQQEDLNVIINQEAAKAIGLTVPPELLAQRK